MNRPVARIDADGQNDFSVFRPYATKTSEHSVVDKRHTLVSVHFSNSDVGTYEAVKSKGAPPTPIGGSTVQADTIAIFQLASQYANAATFTGASGGTGGGTTLAALDG